MRVDFGLLNAFLAVSEAGSVTAAARRLGLAKSVVSRRISEFEGAMVRVLPEDPPTEDTIWAVWPAARSPSRKLRSLADALAQAFAGAPPWER